MDSDGKIKSVIEGKNFYEPFLWNEVFDNVILTVLYPYSHKTRSDSEKRIIKKIMQPTDY